MLKQAAYFMISVERPLAYWIFRVPKKYVTSGVGYLTLGFLRYDVGFTPVSGDWFSWKGRVFEARKNLVEPCHVLYVFPKVEQNIG